MTDKVLTEMSPAEFNDWVINEMMEGWIPLKMYLRTYPDETQLAIDSRVNRKHWKRGVHYNVPAGGGAWVNLPAIRDWAAGKKK